MRSQYLNSKQIYNIWLTPYNSYCIFISYPPANQDKTMLLDPHLAKYCQARYDEIYAQTDIYQQVWDEIKYPDEDFVKDNADEIGDVLSRLFAISDDSFLNEGMAVDQLAEVKNLLIAFRTACCEREAEKRAYQK